MRARAAALAALLAVVALPVVAYAPQGPVELSHGIVQPYMHLGALNIPAGIRPGAWLMFGSANCTASFVVSDAASNLYLTSAAHCTGPVGQRVGIKQDTPSAALAPIEEFGSVVARWPPRIGSCHPFLGCNVDVALISIDPAKLAQVNPTMAGWGGPTGLFTGTLTGPLEVRHYGWGWATWYDHQTRCRVGIAHPDAPLYEWDAHTWWYSSYGGGGDSGSAVVTASGEALGILDWGDWVIPTFVGPFLSTVEGGERFDMALAALEAHTGLDLELVTGDPVSATCS